MCLECVWHVCVCACVRCAEATKLCVAAQCMPCVCF